MESNDNLEQLLKQMYAKETLHDEDIDMKDIVDEEWAKFEAEHFGSEQGKVKSKKVSFLKIAAMFIGVLMLSGIAYAAIHVISSHKQQDQALQEVVIKDAISPLNNPQVVQDSTIMKPIVYEDAELATILSELATFYQVEPVFMKEETKHLRLYFTWYKKQTTDDIVDTFNKFERIHITREDKKLIVE
jgi:hypothetical protein